MGDRVIADVVLSTGDAAVLAVVAVASVAAWKLRAVWADSWQDCRAMAREVRQRQANRRTWARATHTRSRVKVVSGEGPRRETGRGVVAVPASPETLTAEPVAPQVHSEASRSAGAPFDSGIGIATYSTIAGGAEWEAKLATAERRIRQSPLFGDNAMRKVKRTPESTP